MSVALIYASAYGNTATLAQAPAKGITKAGVGVESINCEFTEDEIQAAVENVMDLSALPRLRAYATRANCLGIVSPLLLKSKLAGVVLHGWSGEAVDEIESKLQDAGYRFGFDNDSSSSNPLMLLQQCKEGGTDFAQALKRRRKSAPLANRLVALKSTVQNKQ